VLLLNANGAFLSSTVSGPDGSYTLDRAGSFGLYDGDYYVASQERSETYFDELYDDVVCPGNGIDSCDLGAGTPITISGWSPVTGIDLELDRKGVIGGVITNQASGVPIPNAWTVLWGADGQKIRMAEADRGGEYRFTDLVPGSYFVTTKAGTAYIDELFDDLPCWGGPPDGCDPTKGTALVVGTGSILTASFALEPEASGLAGVVTRSATGEALAGITINVWTDDGFLVTTGSTSTIGRYHFFLPAGTYYVSTANPFGYGDQVYDGLQCEGGSASTGQCDPTTGDPVVVTAHELTDDVSFVLSRPSRIFSDGFEAGGLSGWTWRTP
jgi:hypothetical protein